MPKVISDASICFVLKNHSLKEFKNGHYSRFWPHFCDGPVCTGSSAPGRDGSRDSNWISEM